MKRVFPSLCLAAAFAVGLSAQTPTQTPPQTPPQNPSATTPPSSRAGQNTVTLTGCVKEGDQPNTYILSSIKSDAAKTPASPTAGTAGRTANTPDLSGKDVKLMGAPASVDLSKHVGHTVSITGMLAPQSGMTPRGTTGKPSTTPPSTTPPSTTPPSAGMDKAEPSLNVSSVSMVSASCSSI
jgi:hypothetical protein